MKQLLAGILLATLAYSGWWVYAAHTLRSNVVNWFEAQQTAGIDAHYSDVTVRGFPSRTDLTLTEPALNSADGQLGWRAPFLQILGLSYKQGHVILAWSDTQRLTLPNGAIDVTSDGLRASVIHNDGTLLRSTLEAPLINLTTPKGALALADVTLALHQNAPRPNTYRTALSLGGVAIPSASGLAAPVLPDTLANLRAELTLHFDQPLRFDAHTHTGPRITTLDLHHAELSLDALTVALKGAITLDASGLASGHISITAQNWRDAIAAARQSGNIPDSLADGLTEILTLIATLGGARETLNVTLGLDQGTVFLGPLPIGTVPPLIWP